MKAHQWRPSAALKKRRSNYLSQLDVTGVVAIFFFLVFMFLGLVGVPDEHRSISVDLYESKHALSQSGALKDDAIDIAVAKVRRGSDPDIYIRADARAKYRDVAVVIGQARRTGIDHVVLITEQRDRDLPR